MSAPTTGSYAWQLPEGNPALSSIVVLTPTGTSQSFQESLLGIAQFLQSQGQMISGSWTQLLGAFQPTGTASGGGVTSGPQAFGDNYVITPSVSSGVLTVALKTVAGANPSSSDKITVRIGNTKREIASAISYTAASGTNWCNAGSSEMAANDVDYFLYVIQETGASAGTKIGHSRIPYAKTMADFVNTNTSQKYIKGSWTNFNATDEVENIGRFRAGISASSAHTWSIPSGVVINRPIYESDWLTWTPTVTGFSAAPANTVNRYRIIGTVVQLAIRQPSDGTSDSTAMTITAPFTSKNVTNMLWMASGAARDNSAWLSGLGIVDMQANTNVMNVFKDPPGNAFTASGGKRLAYMSVLTFEI